MSTTEPMAQEQLDAIASRATAAERGPWEVMNGGDNETSTFIDGPDGDVLVHDVRGNAYLSNDYVWVEESNAQFIAHAREDVPALLAEVERLRALTTVDDAMVERGARALWGSGGVDDEEWRSLRECTREHYRADARFVLDAAHGTREGL